MKKLIYSIAIALSFMTIACKKDKAVSITGYWTGSGINTGSSSSSFIGVLYKSDNSARVYILSSDTTIGLKLNATYVIGADSIRTTMTDGSNTTILSSKLNSNATQMNGTFRSLTNSTTGIWSVTKN